MTRRKALPSEVLDGVIDAARAGGRSRVRARVRRIRVQAHLDGFREGYAFAMQQAARRARSLPENTFASEMLEWLGVEARRP